MHESTIETAAAELSLASFHADPAELAAAVAFLAKRVIGKRQTLPILASIHLAADPAGTVTLTADNTAQGASVTIAARVDLPGTVCVDAAPFADAAAKLAKAKPFEVRFTDQGEGRALLAAGRSRFNLKTLPADDFPLAAADPAPLSRFTVPAGRFLADLAALAPFQGNDAPGRAYLWGVALQRREMAGPERLVMVACDGSNMAIASRPMPEGAECLPDYIIPRDAVEMMAKAAKLVAGSPSVEIMAGDRLAFDFGRVKFWTKPNGADFVQWERPFETALAPVESEAVLFPELLPGAPLASMEAAAKGLGQRIDWQPAREGMLGSVPGDDGLLFGCLAVQSEGCQRKGYEYRWDGEGAALAYLQVLAETRGLLTPEGMAARAEAITQAFGDSADSWDYNEGCPYRARPFGDARFNGGDLIKSGNRILGLTISGTVSTVAWTEKVKDWETLTERETYHPAACEVIEGSCSILMPSDGPGQLTSASAITGPDGVEYPVADNGSKIHLSADQVRALIGESCFETMAITLPDGRAAHILRWLWEQGDSRFLTVRPDGRTYPGGVFVTRAEIEAGPVEVEPEAPAVDMPEIAGTEPQEREAEPVAVHIAPEPVEALSEPDLPAAEPVTDAYSLPDGALADLAARVAALEAMIAAPVPVESEAPPVEAIQPRRSPAHERAIRRAWAQRHEIRLQRAALEAANANYRTKEKERDLAFDQMRDMEVTVAATRQVADQRLALLHRSQDKRLATAQRSRRMLASARQAATFQRQRADVLHAQLTELQGRIVDPHAPEQESDLLRLKAERDAALQRAIPLSAEVDRLKAVMVQNAGHIEALASRAVKAEVALRQAGLAPPLPVLAPVEGIAA